jgi:hypothetical protein
MNKWLWLMLIPSLLFADPSESLQAPPDSTTPVTTNEVPVEIEVRADAIPKIFAHRNPDPIYVDVETSPENLDPGLEPVIAKRTVTSPITVLVATPEEPLGDPQKPVFFECRHQQLFSISLERLKQACDDKTAELRAAAAGDETQFLRSAAMTMLEIDGQRLDFTYALMGKYVLTPVRDAKGYSDLKENDDPWFDAQLAELNPETQSLCFFVRPDSFPLFEQARDLARLKKFTVTYEMLDETEPILLAPGGEILSY